MVLHQEPHFEVPVSSYKHSRVFVMSFSTHHSQKSVYSVFGGKRQVMSLALLKPSEIVRASVKLLTFTFLTQHTTIVNPWELS